MFICTKSASTPKPSELSKNKIKTILYLDQGLGIFFDVRFKIFHVQSVKKNHEAA